MPEIQIINSGCEDDREDENGERGKRGKRGRRGHDGFDGPTGPTGPTGTLGPTGPTGSASFPPITGAANVNSTGAFIQQTGFSASTHPAVGEYVLSLINQPPPVPGDDFLVVLITPTGLVGGQVSYLFDPPSTSGVIHVYTFDAAGNPADKSFSIMVYTLAP